MTIDQTDHVESLRQEIAQVRQESKDRDELLAIIKDENTALQAEVGRLREAKDAAYRERNTLVALLARISLAVDSDADGSVGVAKTGITGWDSEWNGCCYIEMAWGGDGVQCSWHYHDRDAHLFERLPAYTRGWDGTTTEKKYEFIKRLLAYFDDARGGKLPASPGGPG